MTRVATGTRAQDRAAVVAGGLASSARSSGLRTIEVETVRFVGAIRNMRPTG